jgi:hypothetical protein
LRSGGQEDDAMEAAEELRSRMTSVLDLIEHEGRALGAFEEPALEGVLHALKQLREEIVAALASLPRPEPNGDTARR